MDRLIRRFDALPDADLMLVERRGIAYQRDMTKGRRAYDAKYLATYERYAQNDIAAKLNAARVDFVGHYARPGSRVLDVGAATGQFVRAARGGGFDCMGFDIIPEVRERLEAERLFACDGRWFDALTFWDSLEHMDEPEVWLAEVPKGAIAIVALPIFEDVHSVRSSKHYKPGEHLYYFTEQGVVDWMALYGFRLLGTSMHEIECGREAIGAFAFKRDLPDYKDYIGMYHQMHESRFYGGSATGLYLDVAAALVRRLQPRSILDYGCGRSDLAVHFWRDGERTIARYDPAVHSFRRMPDKKFDLAFCCDVMEHIPMAGVDKVLREIKAKAPSAMFTISTKPARAKLPDGTNAHVTLLRKTEWARWVKSYLPKLEILKEDEHELVLLAQAGG